MNTKLFPGALLVIAGLCHINEPIKAQTPDLEIFGLSSRGGKYKGGAIFKNNNEGNFVIVKDINKINAANPTGALCKASNGKLYGAASTNRIFEFDPVTGSYTEMHKFERLTLFYGNLIQATNGKLYGMSFPNLGSNGCLFEWDPLTGDYSSKYEIEYGCGMESFGSLVQSSNGLIYGITSCGGAFGDGAIFEWDPENNIYNEKLSFIDTIHGSETLGALTEAENGKFYGITSKGGVNDLGVLFIWDPISNDFCKIIDFNGISTGSHPVGSLILAENDKYYGLARSGGEYNRGVLFEWDPVNQIFTKKYDFDSSTDNPQGSLHKMPDGKLLGITYDGVLFEWNPETNSFHTNYKVTDDDQGTDFNGSLIQADNSLLYGLAHEGGVYSGMDRENGVLFEWNPIDSLFSAKILFNGAPDGMYPVNLVETNDGKFVGAFRYCESNDYGALFEFDPGTFQYSKKFDFNKKQDMFPSVLVKAKGGMLYGYTFPLDGYSGPLTFYKWNPYIDSCTVLFNSMEEDYGGKVFYSGNALITGIDSSRLYGIASAFGCFENCILFELNLDSLAFAKKMTIDGLHPRLLFKGLNGKLYGTAVKQNYDFLFEWDPELNAITQKTDTTYFRFESLAQAPDGKLYGVGTFMGVTCFYEWNTTTNQLINKLNLDDLVGVGNSSLLNTNLTAGQDGNLYGTIYDYNKLDYYVFQWNPLSNDFRKLYDISSEDSADIRQLIVRKKPSSQPVDFTKGLIAFYPLWGNMNDESGNGHHSTMNGVIPAELGHGILGTAYTFTGENNTFLFAGYEVKQPTITICTRVKIDDLSRDTIFLSNSNALKLMIRLVDKRYHVEIQYMGYKVILRDKNGFFEFDPLNPRWADFLVISYDGSQIKLIIEDQIIDSQNLNSSILLAFPATVKKDPDYSFYGILDFIRVYDRILSEKELEYIRTGSYYTVPLLKTDSITNIGKDSATVYSSYKFDHQGKDIYKFGVCWSTSSNPHWSRSPHKFVDYLDSAHTVTYLTGLKPNTLYYLYSYYLTSNVEGFSIENSFVTLPNDSVNLKDGLVAYYPFNGNANDESGNEYHGSVNGATLTTDRFGNENSAYLFDGINDHILIDSAFFNNGWDEYSVSCWVNSSSWDNPSSNVHNQAIINTIPHNGFELCFNWGNTNRYGVFLNSNPYMFDWDIMHNWVSNKSTSIYQWNHLVFVKDINECRLYINGKLDRTFTSSVIPVEYMCKLVLGSIEPVVANEYFNGKLDDYRIYSRTISDQEIAVLYDYQPHPSVYSNELTVINNSEFDILINLAYPEQSDSIFAFQLNFGYNNHMLQYLSYSLDGTLSENGLMEVNEEPGNLVIAWAGQSALADSGTLVRMRFKARESGTVTPVISNFLLNTDTIKNIVNGTITITGSYGDVDGNDAVQAYDAALALQYSVGLDPLPNIDPLPWEYWRVASANVDGQDNISAYDASLILQYTVGLIQSFPVEGYMKSTHDPQADVSVNVENDYLVFRSSGELQGLNIHIEGDPELFGAPQQSNARAILAVNSSATGLSIGLAMANIPPEGEIILKIPINSIPDRSVTMNLLVNNHDKQMNMDKLTGLAGITISPVEIYPNPANTTLYFNNITGETSVKIVDMQGRIAISQVVVGNQVDIGDLSEGVYTIHLTDRNNTTIRKLVKK